jgi:DNA (cytosine-5)-methyltransferase 1
MVGIDLFAGAGGMTLGAKLSGIRVMYAVENDYNSAQTYLHNNEDVIVYNQDIRDIKNLPLSREEELVVFGGPPCQGFSTSNQKTRTASNPNNWLYKEFIRIVKSFTPLPEWVVFENVKGFSETENGIFLESVLGEFVSLGYTINHGILNAAEFGVPQRRNRFFAIASLHGHKIDLPLGQLGSVVTVKEAFADLPSLSNGTYEECLPYQGQASSLYSQLMRGNLEICFNNYVTRNSDVVVKRYSHIPQGGNWEDIPAKLMKNYADKSRCHTGIYHRLKEDEPSIVIGNYRKNMLVHPWENRGLSVREAARLQSFPDWYAFQGSIGFQQQQVGNAVPPMLAKNIFDCIINRHLS